MRNLIGVALVGASLVCACADEPDDLGTETANVTATNKQYVVVFKSDTAPADAAKRIANAGGKVSRLLSGVGVASATGPASFATKLAADPTVLSVGREHAYRAPALKKLDSAPPNGPTVADDLFPYQWDIRRVGAPAVWARTPANAAHPRVAVLDTGVADDHPDLQGQIVDSKSFSACSTSGPAGQPGYPVYASMADFTLAVPDCAPLPWGYHFESHGTHVSGTIAGKFGGGAIVGVAPNAQVGAYKVFDVIHTPLEWRDPNAHGADEFILSAFDDALFAAIIDATNNGYPVISMSLGSTFDKRDGRASYLAWQRVVNYATKHGSLVVAASGNSGLDLNGTTVNIPSDLPMVLAVSATGTNQFFVDEQGLEAAPGSDVLAFYSNFGAPVDVSAPGGDLGPDCNYETGEGCYREYLIVSSYIFEHGTELPGVPAGALGYAWFAGTSMATPHVAAVAAQVRALHPTWSPGTVRGWLKDHAEAIGPRLQFGAGLVNADLAAR